LGLSFVIIDLYIYLLFKITSAAIQPGIHPKHVKINVMRIFPQPRSYTANGGNIMQSKTLNTLIINT